jgi:hypothetical protein
MYLIANLYYAATYENRSTVDGRSVLVPGERSSTSMQMYIGLVLYHIYQNSIMRELD